MYCLPDVFWVMQELHEMIYLFLEEYPVAEDLMPLCSDTHVAIEVHYTHPSPRELKMKGSLFEEWRMQLQQIPFLEEELLVVSRETGLLFHYHRAMAPQSKMWELLKPEVEARQAHRNAQIRHCRVPEEVLEDVAQSPCPWDVAGNILIPKTWLSP